MEVYWLTAEDDLAMECYRLRVEVFVQEQGFRDEFDGTDAAAAHLLLCREGQPVATARVFSEGEETFHIGRICVKAQLRGQGIGRKLLEEAEQYCRNNGGKVLVLGAQVRASGFYEACGFVCFGEEYLDEGCPHIMMKKEI